MPESTLDLFFQHFNTLQQSLERIQSSFSGSDSSSKSSAPRCMKAEITDGLGDLIDALEDLTQSNIRLSEHIRNIDTNLGHLESEVQGVSRDKCSCSTLEKATDPTLALPRLSNADVATAP